MGIFDFLNSAMDKIGDIADAASDIAGAAGDFVSDKLIEANIALQKGYNKKLGYQGTDSLPNWNVTLPQPQTPVGLTADDIQDIQTATDPEEWDSVLISHDTVEKSLTIPFTNMVNHWHFGIHPARAILRMDCFLWIQVCTGISMQKRRFLFHGDYLRVCRFC